MANGVFNVPVPSNEPVLGYLPGSKERIELEKELKRQSEIKIDIPLIINGERIFTEKKGHSLVPHDHKHVLADFSMAGEKELKMAIDAAMAAKENWESMPWEQRASVYLKAADLLSTKYRAKINAATMLGQSKTVQQAEIDSACELADFLRYNVYFTDKLYREQPSSSKGIWNRQDYRALDGFIIGITPFNFTSIGGNLPMAPTIVGNTALWKPSRTSVLSNYYFYLLLEEAGLPAGVINFVPCSGKDVESYVLKDERLAGVHFTGSTGTFNRIWSTIGTNIDSYKQYPRIVGETGGKDFIFAHNTADIDNLVAAMVRGAYEYQGQKCSAASRAYIPKSIWPEVKEKAVKAINGLKVGDPMEFDTFMAAVIDKASFDNIKGYIDDAKSSNDAELITGSYDDSKGYFVKPTLIEAKNPKYRSMVEEIFGPVLTVYVYDDEKLDETLELCDSSTMYALTGAIFAGPRNIINHMEKKLTHAAGNFYINDKPTGAVVGQQPFGGARASGTNDKAGSIFNMVRWVSVHTVKENFIPSSDIAYPNMVK